LLCVGVNTGAGDLTDIAVASVLGSPFDLGGFLEAQAIERFPRPHVERLPPLRSIDLRKLHSVLSLSRIQNRQRIAVHHANYRARNGFT
jgi:hypothetical protein